MLQKTERSRSQNVIVYERLHTNLPGVTPTPVENIPASIKDHPETFWIKRKKETRGKNKQSHCSL